MSEKETNDLEALGKLESEAKNKGIPEKDNKPNLLDGYKVLDRNDMPHQAKLYPENWAFAYRCPTSIEVANFSVVNEADKPGIVIAIEDMIRKCVIIFDVNNNRQISAGEINDSDRTFFLLLLREFYLNNFPITYDGICSMCQEPIEFNLYAKSLKYEELNEKLLAAFDGRMFSLVYPGIEEPIEFLIPTIDISSRIFKFVIKIYKDNDNDKTKDLKKIVQDKQFLLIAPFLYEKGNESIKELANKFKILKTNEKLFAAYLDITNKLNIDNLEIIDTTCKHCESEEEAPIRFPGGWKKLFVNKTDSTGYFS